DRAQGSRRARDPAGAAVRAGPVQRPHRPRRDRSRRRGAGAAAGAARPAAARRATLSAAGRLARRAQGGPPLGSVRGANQADEAENHAYKSVLSRNLGGKPEARADVMEVQLVRGDRLMLCSDGLYGFASTEAVQQLLGSTDAPEQVSKDLIEAALRGGGGDNV